MTIKKYISAALAMATAGVLVLLGVTTLTPAFANAQTIQANVQAGAPGQGNGPWGQHAGNRTPGSMPMHAGINMKPGVIGTVSAINGTTITLSGKQGFGFGSTTAATAVTYTVDASNATIRKNNATSTVSSIATGDTIVAVGTVSGTNVTATTIIDGRLPMMSGNGMGRMHGMASSTNPGAGMGGGMNGSASPITGNGQPVIAGTISAVNGSTLTVTNKSNVTYSVDASNAKIVQGQSTVTVSNISVGDNVIVQGTVNGTSVTASSVIDQKVTTNTGGVGSSGSGQGQPHSNPGVFGAIDSFFKRIFGF